MNANGYHEGYLKWDSSIVRRVSLTVDQVEVAISPTEIVGTTHQFTLIDSAARERAEFRFEIDPTAEPRASFAWLEWMRQDGNIESRIWTTAEEGTLASTLLHAHDFGVNYRLVINASRLQWDGDRVYRLGSDSIRFITGRISGTSSSPAQYQEDGGGVAATFRMGPTTVEGRIIEIVAKTEGDIDARTRCYSILGYLSLIWGPAAVGTVIFESLIDVPLDGDYHATHITRIDWPYNLDLTSHAFTEGLDRLAQVIQTDKMGVSRALERYAQGSSSGADELRLAAFFAGIEVIARDFEKRKGGVPWVKNLADRHKAAFKRFLGSIGEETLTSKIMGSLKHVSIPNSFKYWRQENRLDTEESQRFSEINQKRNDLFHSGDPSSLHDISGAAKGLLQQMLQIELQIPAGRIWNRLPAFQITAPMHYPNYGLGKSGDPDVLHIETVDSGS